jgi:hypothetical protein
MPFRIRPVLPWDGRGLGTASLSDCLEKVGTAKVLPGCQKRGSEIGKAFPVPRCHWLCPHGYQGPQSHPLEHLYRESHAIWIIGYFLPGLASPQSRPYGGMAAQGQVSGSWTCDGHTSSMLVHGTMPNQSIMGFGKQKKNFPCPSLTLAYVG